jgi:hypothetical protein
MKRKGVFMFVPFFVALGIFAGGMLYADVDVVAEGGKTAAVSTVDLAALKKELKSELKAELLREMPEPTAAPEVSESAISDAVSRALGESGIMSGLFKGTTVSGYLETIFTYNLRQHGEDSDRTLAGTGLSNADIAGWNYLGERNDNSFALEAFAIFFDKETTDESPIGWQAHLYFGEKAKRITFLGAGGFQGSGNGTGTDDTARNDIVTVSAANITWDAPVLGKKLPITMGKMYTWIGYELVENIGNPNYSHGLIYNNAIPFTHMGMSFDVSEFLPSDKFGLQLKYVNGWDSFIDNNESKSYGFYLTYEPNDDWFVSLATIYGNEGWNARTGTTARGLGNGGTLTAYTSENNGGATMMYDIVATYALPQVEKLSLGFNFDHGYIEEFNAHDGSARPEGQAGTITGLAGAHWWATALYAMYDWTDNQMGALRYEYFDDQDHARTFGYSLWDITYTHNITVSENLMIRPEIRYIHHNTIEGDNEPSVGDKGNTADDETILTLGVEYVF